MISVCFYRVYDSSRREDFRWRGLTYNHSHKGAFTKKFHSIEDLVRFKWNSPSLRIASFEGLTAAEKEVFKKKIISFSRKRGDVL